MRFLYDSTNQLRCIIAQYMILFVGILNGGCLSVCVYICDYGDSLLASLEHRQQNESLTFII